MVSACSSRLQRPSSAFLLPMTRLVWARVCSFQMLRHLAEVRHAYTRHGVPPLGGVESVRAAQRRDLAARVVALGDVAKDRRAVIRQQLVQPRI